MAITLDVITRPVEASLNATSRQIKQKMGAASKESADQFARDWQKSTDKVADNIGQIAVAQQRLNELQAKGASRSQLIAAQEKINKLQREQNRLLTDATNLQKRVTTEVRELGNGFDVVNRGASGVLNVIASLTGGTRFGGITSGVASMASGFTEAGVAVGGLSASMTAAAGIAGGALVVGLAAAAAGAVALTKELYDLGSEWDNTFDNIIVKTGATGDVLEQIKSSIRGVAGEVPASLDVIGDAAAGVAQNLKLVGPEAEDMIKSLARLKSYGIDVDVHSLAMSFRALNVEQSDYQATLQKFLNFSQETGVPIDSITSAVESNAGALQAFGFTVDEVLGLMRNFEAQGIDPDKGLGALNRAFNGLATNGLPATKAGLQMVFDDLNRLKTTGTPEALQLANEEINQLFGARGGGLSWLPIVEDGNYSLQELTGSGEAAQTSIEDMGTATDDLAEQWMMFKQDTKAALEPLSTEVFKFANEALGSITAWLKESKPEIIGFFTFASTQVVNFAQMIVESIGFAFMQIGTLGEKIPFIGSKFKGLKEAGQDLLTFGNKLGDLQTKLQDVGDRANERAENARNFSKEMNNNLKILDDGKTVVLKDTSAEVLENIDKTKYEVENLPDGQVKITPKTEDATREMQDWVDEQNGVLIEPEVKPDTTGADKFLEDWKKALEGKPIDIPVTTDPFNPGGVLGPGIPTPGGPRKFAAGAAMNRYEPGMVPNNRLLMDAVSRFFPTLKASADTGRRDSFGEHGAGEALDVSVNPGNQLGIKTPEGQMTGNQVNQWMLQNADRLGIQYTIWQGKQWNPDGTTAPNGGQGITGGHWDHVHARVRPGSPMQRFGPGGSDGSGIMPPYSGAGMLNYGPDDVSPLPPGTPSPIAGLEPGPVGSTFGYNEYGEPGYYRPDSKSISNAERAADKAEDRVAKAQERIDKINEDIAAKEAQRTAMNSQQTDKDIADLRDQLKTANEAKTDAEEQRDLAKQNLAEARQGRFTEARESRRGKSGGMGQVGADLADDFGLSEGLPGVAQWLTTFLANLAFAPAIGALSAVSAVNPIQGGYGLMGMMGAQNVAAGGSPLGLSLPPVTPSIGPAPLGGGVGPASPMGVPHSGSGAAPGPQSYSPSVGPGGGGFSGLGGLPLAGLQAATAGLDIMAPGAGQAAQVGIQLANRTAAYAGQLAGIGVGGLLETFLPHGSPLADPNKSWVGRIAAGFAGARPALPNTAGGDQGMNPAGVSAKPQTPEEAQALQAQTGGGQANGPMVQVGAINNYTPDGGQSLANQIGRMQLAGYASGGKR